MVQMKKKLSAHSSTTLARTPEVEVVLRIFANALVMQWQIIVQGCTNSDVVPKPEFRPRKERYIGHLPDASESVKLVSASDKLHNARAILRDYRTHGDKLWSRFTGGKEGTLWYYRELANVFGEVGKPELAAQLNRVVSEIEKLSESQKE
jgi:(p)ppGpp synthase/HD superfamily hydrolase